MHYTRRRVRLADARGTVLSLPNLPLTCCWMSIRGIPKQSSYLYEARMRLSSIIETIVISGELPDNPVCAIGEDDADHERNCMYQCARTRRISVCRPRTEASEASQIQPGFLLSFRYGKNCLKDLLFCASPPVSALVWVVQACGRRLLDNRRPWLAG